MKKNELPLILDATCGARMLWFDKNNPLCLFVDRRELSTNLCDGRVFEVKPDVIADFTNLPFEDKKFKLVVFDPPHLQSIGESSYMAIKYGKIGNDWRDVLKQGFSECMRVLDDYGTLVFKWSETEIKTSDVIKTIGVEPLFGHISGRLNKTHWMCFMKLPEETC